MSDAGLRDVGFVGFGIMGRGMVRNLIAAGHAVTLWNRTRRPLPEGFEACTVAPSIAAAVAGKPVVVVCLTGPDAQRDTLRGDDGVFANAAPGTLVADATTTDPTLTLELAAEAGERGLRYLDTPVFGSKNEAWEGKLDFVCGGDRADYDAVLPVLQTMAATVHYMGGPSKGAAAKLVGNLLVAAQMVSLGRGAGDGEEGRPRERGADGLSRRHRLLVGPHPRRRAGEPFRRFLPALLSQAHAEGRPPDRRLCAPPSASRRRAPR